MVRPPEQIVNTLQTFMRIALLETRPTTKHSRGLCPSCLQRDSRPTRHQIRSPRIWSTDTWASPLNSRLIRYEARQARSELPGKRQGFATVSDGTRVRIYTTLLSRPLLTRCLVPNARGPIEEYEERVHARVLRDDEHQRSLEEFRTGVVVR